MRDTLILHDLDADAAAAVFADVAAARLLATGCNMAACTGCYGCWLKTPGRCVLRDGWEAVGKALATCRRLVILSRNCYGGYSPGIKNALDRGLSLSLPFFAVRGGELHHRPRYESRPEILSCFYGDEDITREEKALAQEIAHANAVNLNAAGCEVLFLRAPSQLREVLA